MNRAFVGNLQQLGSLFVRQRARKMNVAFDSIEHSLFGFAFGAIGGVDLRVPQMNRDLLERPGLAAGVHPHSHRSTRSQSGEEQIVGRRSRIRAAGRRRFVGSEPMPAGINFLRESGSAAADDHTSYVAFFHSLDRINWYCPISTSRRRLLAALQECKQLRVDLVLESGAHAVRRARNDFQRGALDQLRG